MRLMTIPDVIEYSGFPESKVRRAANSGALSGQIVAGTYIFTKQAVDSWLGPAVNVDFPALLTVNTATKQYGVSRNRLYNLLRSGDLSAVKVKTRGGFGWSYVFTEADLLAVGKDLGRVSPGPAVKDNVDRHLERSSDRWAIKGTKNKHGQPFIYRHKNQARRRAREAYSEPPLYKAGDTVFIKPRSGIMTEVVLTEDVTWIDQTIFIKYDNGAPAFVPISWLWSKK